MTLSAYFAAAAEHQQLAWMNDTILEVLVDSAVSDGQVSLLSWLLGPSRPCLRTVAGCPSVNALIVEHLGVQLATF